MNGKEALDKPYAHNLKVPRQRRGTFRLFALKIYLTSFTTRSKASGRSVARVARIFRSSLIPLSESILMKRLYVLAGGETLPQRTDLGGSVGYSTTRPLFFSI